VPVSYRLKWMLRLPVHYTLQRFVQENYNENCFETLLYDKRYDCLTPIQDKFSEMGEDVQYMEDRDLVNSTIEKVLKEQMEPEELKTVEKHHRSMSEAIGFQVGVTKMKELESLKPGSLYTSNLNLYYDILDKLHSKSTDSFLESKNKENFL
jgi:hypothetical protein